MAKAMRSKSVGSRYSTCRRGSTCSYGASRSRSGSRAGPASVHLPLMAAPSLGDVAVLDDGLEAVARAHGAIDGEDALDRDRVACPRGRMRGRHEIVGARRSIARAVAE